MDNVWLASALWVGLALMASVLSIWIAFSVVFTEIIVGGVAGNLIGLPPAPWVNYLAGFGAILLTFLAGAEIDPEVVRRHFRSSMSIGIVGFLAPYLGVMLFARFVAGWPWPQAQIAGISLSTTSVAVVYAVMVETSLRVDLRALRPDEPRHRPASVHHPPHRRDRQRGRADSDCPALVPARVQADPRGGCGQAWGIGLGEGNNPACMRRSSYLTMGPRAR